MRVLFLSKAGKSNPIAYRIAEEGHAVTTFIDCPEAKCKGDGYINKLSPRGRLLNPIGKKPNISLIRTLLQFEPDLIVFDSVGYGSCADTLRKMGFPVFGGSVLADTLELNQVYGVKIMTLLDIATSQIPLADFATNIYLSTSFWFDGTKARLFSLAIKDRHFMAGDVGMDISTAGVTTMLVEKTSRVITEGIAKIEGFLRKSPYHGTITLNSFIVGDGLYAENWKCGFDYDSIYGLLELCKGNVCEMFHGFASGKVAHYEFHKGLSIGVRLSIPPYPNQGSPAESSIQFEPNARKHLWFDDVVADDKGRFYCAGYNGVIGCVTAGGRSLREVKERCYFTIGKMDIENMQYRNDVGDGVSLKDLSAWL